MKELNLLKDRWVCVDPVSDKEMRELVLLLLERKGLDSGQWRKAVEMEMASPHIVSFNGVIDGWSSTKAPLALGYMGISLKGLLKMLE